MNLDRRTVLIGGGAGIGLIVAYSLWPRHLKSVLAAGRGEETFGNTIKIARDGRITVAVPQVETGQGIWTGLPQIVARRVGAVLQKLDGLPQIGAAVLSRKKALDHVARPQIEPRHAGDQLRTQKFSGGGHRGKVRLPWPG